MSIATKSGRKPKAAKNPKKSSASYPHEKPIRVNAEDLKNYKPPKTEVERLRRMKDSGIDYSDIPPLTPEQIAKAVSLREFRRRIPVSVRLDPRVLEWLKSKGEGHLTRINDILLNLMEAEQKHRGA
jgi:uncharacterized protein (DUF4415 family)